MKAKLIAETLGTFFLVMAVGLGTAHDASTAPIAIGFTLMVMVYAGGNVSGAHYNPAVTLAAWIRGVLPAGEVAPYWAAQFIGAFVACFLVYKFSGVPVAVGAGEGVSTIKMVVGEITWTFGLAYVVLHAATLKASLRNSYFGLAIGGTVLAGGFVMGPITGGAFNPAVGVTPALFSMILGRAAAPHAWAYLVGPVVGAAAAALTFKQMHGDEG